MAQIIDHEQHTTEQDIIADRQGTDRTLIVPPIKFGVRVRRIKWQHKRQFTVDLQEWHKDVYPRYYVFGYGELNDNEQHTPKPFSAYILFNYQVLKSLVKTGTIKIVETILNKEHSLVWFHCFNIDDILKHKLAIDWGGTDLTYFKNEQKQKHL